MIDSMFQAGTDTALDDMVRRPAPERPVTPKFSMTQLAKAPWQGIGAGTAKGIAFQSEILGAFGQVAGAYPEALGVMPNDEQAKQAEAARRKVLTQGIDYSNEIGDTFRARAKDILPDPQTTHASAQVVAGLADFATRAVGYTVAAGPVGPLFLGGDVALEESDRLKAQGVDIATRTKAGGLAGTVAAASVALPMTGATAVIRGAKGVAIGEAAMVGQAAGEKAILKAAGYDKIADTYDPLDPVSLALGLVPGGLAARFGHAKVGKLRTEADVRGAAQFTPAEQAHANEFERSAGNLRELEAAIAAEKRPEVKAQLEAELGKQRTAGGESAARAAVDTNPELVPAARVMQVTMALERSRLTDDLAGADRHITAVEMAADQMGRGEPVRVNDVVMPSLERAADASRANPSMPEPVGLQRGAEGALGRDLGQTNVHADDPGLVQARDDRGALPPEPPPAPSPATAEALTRLQQTVDGVRELVKTREPLKPAPETAPTESRARATIDTAKQEFARSKGDAKAIGESQAAPEVKNLMVGLHEAGTDTARAGRLLDAFDRSARQDQRTPLQDLAANAVEEARRPAKDEALAAIDRAATEVATTNPDMLVKLTEDGEPMRVADLLEAVRREAETDMQEARLVEVAAACALRT